MLRPVRPDPTAPEPEVCPRHLATFASRGHLPVDVVSDLAGRPVGAEFRSPTSGSGARPEVAVAEIAPGRSRWLAHRTGNAADRMRLMSEEENGRYVQQIASNPAVGRDGGSASPRTMTVVAGGAAMRRRSSEGWERGGDPSTNPQRSATLTIPGAGGPMSPLGGIRTSSRSSSGCLQPRLGRPLVGAAASFGPASPSLPVDVHSARPGAGTPQSPGIAGAGWWKASSSVENRQRNSDGSQASFNATSTAQRPVSNDEDSEPAFCCI